MAIEKVTLPVARKIANMTQKRYLQPLRPMNTVMILITEKQQMV